MATERDFELLDDYLANRLGSDEKASFEQKLAGDPGLKAELGLQQRMIQGIRDVRAAELKAMLQALPVPAGSGIGNSMMMKWVGGSIVAGAIATGAYFFFNDQKAEEETKQALEQGALQQPLPADPTEQKPLNETEASEDDATSEVKKETAPINKEQKSAEKAIGSSSQEAKQPVLDVYDPASEDGASGEQGADETASQLAAGERSVIVVEVDKLNKKYQFHYQFKEGRLYLYGPFEKNLYEILEFFGENDERTVFLFYKDGYYLLNEDDAKIKSLEAITDQKLVQKLKAYRGN